MARISTGLYGAWIRGEVNGGVKNPDFDTKAERLYITTPGGIQTQYTKEQDPAFLGNSFPSAFETVNQLIQGAFSFSGHPEMMGTVLYHHLGKQKSVGVAPAGSLCIFYSGTAQSCLLDITAGVLTAEVGAEGSEIADVNFNTTGSITLGATGFTTIDELVTAIKGFTGYRAFKIGLGSALAVDIANIAQFQVKGSSFSSRTAKFDSVPVGVLAKKITLSSMIIGESAQSYTVTDTMETATGRDFLGLKGGQITLDMPNGGLMTGTANVLGKNEDVALTLPAVNFEGTRPMVSGNVAMYINGRKLGYNQVNIDYNPNLFTEVEGNSFFQAEAQNGKSVNCSISPAFHYNTDTATDIYEKFKNGATVEVIIVFETFDNAETGIPYSFFWRFTRCQITESNIDGGGEVFNLPSKIDVLQPTDNVFRPVECEVITKKATFVVS